MGVGEEILKGVQELHAKVDRLLATRAPATPVAPAGEIAPDSDLDGKYGDIDILRDPKRWKGAPLAPIKASQAPAEYLELYAGLKDWQAEQDEKKGTEEDARKASYARRDAARARGWAKRARERPAPPPSFDAFDEVPF